jgi:hypothetical protein
MSTCILTKNHNGRQFVITYPDCDNFMFWFLKLVPSDERCFIGRENSNVSWLVKMDYFDMVCKMAVGQYRNVITGEDGQTKPPGRED